MTSIKITNIPVQPLFLGFPGENDSRPVYVDVSPWLEEFPDATVSIVYTRSDGRTYAVVVNQPGPVVTWKPMEADLVEGKCKLQIQIKQGDAVKKDSVVDCYVGNSLDDPSDPPQDPRPTYVEEVIDAADRAEEAVEHYPQIRNDYWWAWDAENGEWVNTGVKASGEGGGAVESVNGQTGAVVLDAEDVGALPDDTVIPSQIGQLSDNVGLVHYNSQTLADAQQAQARENIGAAASATLLSMLIPILRDGLYGTDQTAAINALEVALGGTPEPEDPIETYTPEMTEGYINVTTGATGGTSTYKHTEIIPVREGDKVYGTSFDSTYNVTIPRIRARFTAAYDANGAIYPAGGSNTQADYEEGTPFVVPAGVYGVVFSIVNSLANQVVVYVDKSERVGA